MSSIEHSTTCDSRIHMNCIIYIYIYIYPHIAKEVKSLGVVGMHGLTYLTVTFKDQYIRINFYRKQTVLFVKKALETSGRVKT